MEYSVNIFNAEWEPYFLTGKMPEDYIRKGTKGCEVELYFDDNSVFKRSRSKKDNIAIANENKYERVGKDIPFDYFLIPMSKKIYPKKYY